MSRTRSILAACVVAGITVALVGAGVPGVSGSAPAETIPLLVTGTTTAKYCDTDAACTLGPIPGAGAFVVGVVPAFVGTVDVTLENPDGEILHGGPHCTIPHTDDEACTLIVSGEDLGTFRITGTPGEGTTGGYSLWVMFE